MKPILILKSERIDVEWNSTSLVVTGSLVIQIQFRRSLHEVLCNNIILLRKPFVSSFKFSTFTLSLTSQNIICADQVALIFFPIVMFQRLSMTSSCPVYQRCENYIKILSKFRLSYKYATWISLHREKKSVNIHSFEPWGTNQIEISVKCRKHRHCSGQYRSRPRNVDSAPTNWIGLRQIVKPAYFSVHLSLHPVRLYRNKNWDSDFVQKIMFWNKGHFRLCIQATLSLLKRS